MIEIAEITILVVLSIFLVFHFCVLFKLTPYTNIWGGRLKSDKEMIPFVVFSILVISFYILVTLDLRIIDLGIINDKFQTIVFWIMALSFSLNILGNLLSKNKLEKYLFAPMTVILAAASFILALT